MRHWPSIQTMLGIHGLRLRCEAEGELPPFGEPLRHAIDRGLGVTLTLFPAGQYQTLAGDNSAAERTFEKRSGYSAFVFITGTLCNISGRTRQIGRSGKAKPTLPSTWTKKTNTRLVRPDKDAASQPFTSLKKTPILRHPPTSSRTMPSDSILTTPNFF